MKLIIGCGKMGGAILEGWLQSGITDVIALAETAQQAQFISNQYKIDTVLSVNELKQHPESILCAVKPYHIEGVLKECSAFNKSTFISVVVGKSIEYMRKFLGSEATIVRTMPNIPCLIKQGVIGVYADKQRKDIDVLLSTVGKIFWLKDEKEIELVAALPGGLPAFLMKILKVYAEEISKITKSDKQEVMRSALDMLSQQKKSIVIDHIINGWVSDAKNLGLEGAEEMALRTTLGTIELLKSMSPDEIITAVASKKGTTEAGLTAIDHSLSPIIAAYRRALEINNEVGSTAADCNTSAINVNGAKL